MCGGIGLTNPDATAIHGMKAETDWHLMWKDAFPSDCQELVQIDENTGEKHVADVKTPSGVVVEVQHSRISEDELRSREDFYSDMIWIVDARDVVWMTSRDLVSVEPIAYGSMLLNRTTLLKRWSSAKRPVYFDNTQNVLSRQGKRHVVGIASREKNSHFGADFVASVELRLREQRRGDCPNSGTTDGRSRYEW